MNFQDPRMISIKRVTKPRGKGEGEYQSGLLLGSRALLLKNKKKPSMDQKQSGALFTRLTVKLVLNFVWECSGSAGCKESNQANKLNFDNLY